MTGFLYGSPLDSQAVMDSAKGETCTIRLPYTCNHNPETTVFCHGKKIAGGGGFGIKPDLLGGAYGCYACHLVVDGHVGIPAELTRLDVIEAFHSGHVLTLRRLRVKGLLFIAGVDT